jgi:hypothetical protein
LRVGASKVLLAVLAAVILALGFVAYRVVGGDGREADPSAVERGFADSRRPEPTASGARETGEPAARKVNPPGRGERRRLRNAQQRQKLIAAIEMARAARLQGRLPAGDRADSTEDLGEGELSKETIRGAVQAVIEDVKACYEEQLEVSPDLGGKIIVDFTINAEEGVGGVVDRVEVSDESDEPMRMAEQLTECIVDTIYTLELPEPKGGGTVDVSYPMIMSPGGSR